MAHPRLRGYVALPGCLVIRRCLVIRGSTGEKYVAIGLGAVVSDFLGCEDDVRKRLCAGNDSPTARPITSVKVGSMKQRTLATLLLGWSVLGQASWLLAQTAHSQRSFLGWVPAGGSAELHRPEYNSVNRNSTVQAAYYQTQDAFGGLPPLDSMPNANTSPGGPSGPIPAQTLPRNVTLPRDSNGSGLPELPPPQQTAQPIQSGYQQPDQLPAGAAGGNQLRQIGQQTTAGGGRIDPNTITTGPPFVTPAPRSRYPTSPYNRALFQNVAYQRQLASQSTATGTGSGIQAQPNRSRSTVVTAQPASHGTVYQQATPHIYPTAYECPPGGTLPAAPYAGVPGTGVPGTITPDMAPAVYSYNNAGWKPLLSFGQENFNVQLGRGIIGQPTVYVPRQPIRNFFRYIFP